MKKGIPSATISFRIDGKLANELRKKAFAERTSMHDYARGLFLDALAGQELQDELNAFGNDLQDIRGAVHDLRADLARVLAKFLVELTNLEEEEAEAWVDSYLK